MIPNMCLSFFILKCNAPLTYTCILQLVYKLDMQNMHYCNNKWLFLAKHQLYRFQRQRTTTVCISDMNFLCVKRSNGVQIYIVIQSYSNHRWPLDRSGMIWFHRHRRLNFTKRMRLPNIWSPPMAIFGTVICFYLIFLCFHVWLQ